MQNLSLLVVGGDLVGHLLIIDGGLQVEAVGLKTVLGGDHLLSVDPELLGVVDYPLDFLLEKTALQ